MQEEHKKSHQAVTNNGSALSKYQDVMVGQKSFLSLLYYEWCMFLGLLPGAPGLLLRKLFWPRMFGSCGNGVQFGQNMVVRHPNRIHLGNNIVFSEMCILDARTERLQQVLSIGNDVILSNNVMISCKDGTVVIGARTGIGAQTIIQSTSQCPVSIGDDVIIGPRVYLVGGGNYNMDRLDIPIKDQGIKDDGGIQLADDVWLGANVSVLGGVEMATGSVAATGAVVTKSVAERTVCAGVPAKAVKVRGAQG